MTRESLCLEELVVPLEQRLGQQLLEPLRLRAQPFDIVTRRFARSITGQPFLAASRKSFDQRE